MKSTQHNFELGNSFERINLPDASVDLVVTSPPYPMVEMWDATFSEMNPELLTLIANEPRKAFEEIHKLLDRSWQECYRVLKDGGFACINIGDATRSFKGNFQMFSNHSRILMSCFAAGFEILPSVIWRKPTNAPNKFMGSGMLPAGAYVTLEHEMILILRKNGKRIFSNDERKIRQKSALFWEERNQYFSDQWTDVTGTRQKMHLDSLRKRSAAFPIDIPIRLIQMYSQYYDTVLDPFSGTGTTAQAAAATMRNSFNIDNDTELLESSVKLIARQKTKGELNHLITNRLYQHLNYVHAKNLLFFRYRNKFKGFPVKTLQEKLLDIFYIKSITRDNNSLAINYRKIKKSELRELSEEFFQLSNSFDVQEVKY